MRLHLYLNFFINSLILFTFICFGSYTASEQIQYNQEGIKKDALNMAQNIAATVSNDVQAEHFDKLEDTLLRLVTISNVHNLLITNAKGHILSQVQRNPSSTAQIIFPKSATEFKAVIVHESQNEDYYTLWFPIKQGTHLGWVRITSSLQDLHEIRKRIWCDTVIASLLTILFTTTFLTLLTQHIGKKMDAASLFANNLIHHRGSSIQVHSRILEISTLYTSLNKASQILLQQFQELQDSQARKEAMLKASLDSLISIDIHGHIVDFNPAAEMLFGYQSNEVLGKSMHKLIIPPEYRHAHILGLQHYRETGEGPALNKRFEIIALHRNGNEFPIELSIVPFTSCGTQHFLGSIRDISEQKEQEEILKSHRERLELLALENRNAAINLAEARVQELAIGSQIQQVLLFEDIPVKIGGMSIAVYTEASKGIDGDFYDFLNLGSNCFDLSIGDVMGKGIPAALIGAAFKQELNRTISMQMISCNNRNMRPSPMEIINGLHEIITPKLIELGAFVTMFYVRIDIPLKRITFIDAGHTQAILTGANGIRLLSSDNMPLGVLQEERYQQHEVNIDTGDLIFLYSDGLTEARNSSNEEFGITKLSHLIQYLNDRNIPASILVQAVRKELYLFENYAPLSDDRTCVALQFNNESKDLNANRCFDLSWQLAGLNLLRQEITALSLCTNFQEATRNEIILAAFEAATNIIRHTECPLPNATIHCSLEATDAALNISFYYLGKPYSEIKNMPDFSGNSDGGFGLFIIHNSVDEIIYDSPAANVCRIWMSKKYESSLPTLVDHDV